MKVFLDTNYLIRFLTRDIEKQAEVAKKTIENEKVYITTIVWAETVYILESHYQAKKDELCTILHSLIKQPNIYTPAYTTHAFEMYQSENISFYDCLLLAEAIKDKCELATFDEKLPKIYQKYLNPLQAS